MNPSDLPLLERIQANLAQWRRDLSAEVQEQVNAVVEGGRPAYVFGCNPNAAHLAAHLSIAGFLSEVGPERFLDRPVLPPDALPSDAVVINAVLHKQPHRARARLQQLLPQVPVLHYSDFVRFNERRYAPLPWVAEAQQAFAAHADRLAWLGDRLGDPVSRATLVDLWCYRLTSDPVFTAGYRLAPQEQYFDLGLDLPGGCVFVDGGAFQGETTAAFIERYPHYGAAHLFEPNPESMRRAQEALASRRDVYFHAAALGDAFDRGIFDSSQGAASRLSQAGDAVVNIVPLDEEIDGPVHFVKFDLEGFEQSALHGARHLIRAHHPYLAICVYHRPQDFWEIAQTVIDMRSDYRLVLRHYTEGWEETVLYFLPSGQA